MLHLLKPEFSNRIWDTFHQYISKVNLMKNVFLVTMIFLSFMTVNARKIKIENSISAISIATKNLNLPSKQNLGLASSIFDAGSKSDSAITNIALNKSAEASSVETDGTQAYKAFDGNSTTRWASAENTNTAWIWVDLGSVMPISKLVLKWEYSYAKAYQIEVSTDAVNWKSIYTTANGDGDSDIISNLTEVCQFVRMNAAERGTIYGYSLLEFEVYDTHLVNVALNKTYKASSVETDGTQQNKAFDGDTLSRWGSKESSDLEWIYVDLGAVFSLTKVSLKWELAYAKSYQIQLSNDAINWTTIYSTTTCKGGADEISGLQVAGRYVRMYATERGTEWGYSIYEFAVYGDSL